MMSTLIAAKNMGNPLDRGVSPRRTISDENVTKWYPMRVTYNREMSVDESLRQQGVETFLPTRRQLVERGGRRRFVMVPMIHNLLFVHSSRKVITELKSKPELSPLRYIMSRPLDPKERPHVVDVPLRQMENFIRVASADASRVMFLDYSTVADKVGRRVVITEGDFAGVEGVVKRVKKNRHVVIELKDVAAVAIAFVPSAFLQFVDE